MPVTDKTAREDNRSEAGAAPKSKADVLGLVIFAMVALNLLTVGAMGYFLSKLWTRYDHLQRETEALKAVQRSQQVEEEERDPAAKPGEIGILYPIESFLVNIASDQGPKFLQAQLEFELVDPALENEIARKKPAIRDAIIVMLSSRTYREMRDPKGLKKLREDIQRTVNNILTTGDIKAIYFTQFHFN